MSITVGHVYKFAFHTDIASLNEIYKVTHALDYNTLLEDDVDLLDKLFTPAGLGQAELDAALPTIMLDTFYRLVGVDGTVELYVPYSYINGIPVPDVFEYAKLMLGVDLGPWAEPDVLATLKTTVSQYLQDGFGIIEEPKTMVYDKVWMAESDYEAILAAREAVKAGGSGVINYFTESKRLQETIDAKDARIAALEDLVRQLDAELNP